jgi:hypothetical protein
MSHYRWLFGRCPGLAEGATSQKQSPGPSHGISPALDAGDCRSQFRVRRKRSAAGSVNAMRLIAGALAGVVRNNSAGCDIVRISISFQWTSPRAIVTSGHARTDQPSDDGRLFINNGGGYAFVPMPYPRSSASATMTRHSIGVLFYRTANWFIATWRIRPGLA